ncbi:uncharacterized protein LOC118439341 isoform X3 [Folsomia candida]|uniref:uncharacterized protein LOC118439341 isoform X3 n=1 Tax=Folsomia candida TaxID=158441 RepID=UPI001604F9B0|nr:uncharacterized protein LOC118439341 isoform X3 [Folsomia candida]
MYRVVKFTSDGSVQLVPSTWITKDSKCKWPPGPCTNISSLIKNRKNPKTDWIKLPVKLYKSSDDYATGKQLEEAATRDPELNSTDSEVSNLTKKRGKNPKVHNKLPTSPVSSSEADISGSSGDSEVIQAACAPLRRRNL